MSELRPCQRCKEALRLSVQTNHEFYGPDESLYFFVLCSACGHSSHSEYSREEAIKDWNTRPIEDAQSAEIEQLNERVTELSNALLVEKADNARMRKALETIFDRERHERCYQAEDVKYVFAYHYHEFRQIAEKALKGGE